MEWSALRLNITVTAGRQPMPQIWRVVSEHSRVHAVVEVDEESFSHTSVRYTVDNEIPNSWTKLEKSQGHVPTKRVTLTSHERKGSCYEE
jgi:hypothetical protein